MIQDKPEQIIFRDRALEATVFEDNGQTFVIALVPPEGAKLVIVYGLDRLGEPVPLTSYWRPPIDTCNNVQPELDVKQCQNTKSSNLIERLKQRFVRTLTKKK